jgi:hypothetical protein
MLNFVACYAMMPFLALIIAKVRQRVREGRESA